MNGKNTKLIKMIQSKEKLNSTNFEVENKIELISSFSNNINNLKNESSTLSHSDEIVIEKEETIDTYTQSEQIKIETESKLDSEINKNQESPTNTNLEKNNLIVERISNMSEIMKNKEMENSNVYKENEIKLSKNRKESANTIPTYSTTLSNRQEDSIFQEHRDVMDSHAENHSGCKLISKFIESNANMINCTSISNMKFDNLTHSDDEKLLQDKYKMILDKVNTIRTKANGIFKKNKFKEALKEYQQAIELINDLKNRENKYPETINLNYIVWIRSECLNNMAVCSILVKDYEKCVEYTQEVK